MLRYFNEAIKGKYMRTPSVKPVTTTTTTVATTPATSTKAPIINWPKIGLWARERKILEAAGIDRTKTSSTEIKERAEKLFAEVGRECGTSCCTTLAFSLGYGSTTTKWNLATDLERVLKDVESRKHDLTEANWAQIMLWSVEKAILQQAGINRNKTTTAEIREKAKTLFDEVDKEFEASRCTRLAFSFGCGSTAKKWALASDLETVVGDVEARKNDQVAGALSDIAKSVVFGVSGLFSRSGPQSSTRYHYKGSYS